MWMSKPDLDEARPAVGRPVAGPVALAPDPRVAAFAELLDAAGGVIERLIGGVTYRATLDVERAGIIFSARAEAGPWPVAYAEAFGQADEACFEGWCMDLGGWIEGIDSAEAALAWAADELVEREESLRRAGAGRPESAADFRRYRPSRRGPAG